MRAYIGKLISFAVGQRVLLPKNLARGTEASDLINRIIDLRGFNGSYLEVGVENGLTLEAVNIRRRIAVDPYPRFRITWLTPRIESHKLTSNAFFGQNNKVFDIIYLDGLHTAEQTLMDLHNALKKLSNNGVIVIDDTIPNDEFSAIPNQDEAYRLRKKESNSDDTSWHGDVYKVVCIITSFMKDSLNVATVTSLKNPKTIIWKKADNIDINWELDKYSKKLNEQTYKETFANGVPPMFNPVSWNQFEEMFLERHKSISE
jgi:hypothetical protein